MLKLTVNISGKSFSDLEIALEEVTSKVSQEYVSGMDRNESGRYHFEIEGEEEIEEENEE